MARVQNDGGGIDDFAAWMAGISFQDLPDDVIRRAALVVVDDIAAAIAARGEPEVRHLHDRLIAARGPAEATIFRGGRTRVSRADAILANGTAANWGQLDEGYRKAMCHAGLYAVPAVAAEAEVARHSVAEVLRAVVISYELVGRLARAWHFLRSAPHPHAAWSAIGAAAGLAALRRLTASEGLAALAAAATLAMGGPFGHAIKGALVVNAWAGIGAANGLRAVELAECGIGGIMESPGDVFGGVFGAEADPVIEFRDFGSDWAIRDGYHKIHSCCQQSHSTVEAMLAALCQMPAGRDSSDIEAVEVEIHGSGLALDNRQPANTLAARFSVPHIAAAVAVFGNADTEAFAAPSLGRTDISRIRACVTMRPFVPEMPWPNDRPARVTLVLSNGARIIGECLSAPGGPDRPYATDTILEKVKVITGPVYPSFAITAMNLVAGNSDLYEQPWDSVVAAMTAA